MAAFQSASSQTRSSPSRQTRSSDSQPSSIGRPRAAAEVEVGGRAARARRPRRRPPAAGGSCRCPRGPTATARAAAPRGRQQARTTCALAPATKLSKRAVSREPHAQRQLLHQPLSPSRAARARARRRPARRE